MKLKGWIPLTVLWSIMAVLVAREIIEGPPPAPPSPTREEIELCGAVVHDASKAAPEELKEKARAVIDICNAAYGLDPVSWIDAASGPATPL